MMVAYYTGRKLTAQGYSMEWFGTVDIDDGAARLGRWWDQASRATGPVLIDWRMVLPD